MDRVQGPGAGWWGSGGASPVNGADIYNFLVRGFLWVVFWCYIFQAFDKGFLTISFLFFFF